MNTQEQRHQKEDTQRNSGNSNKQFYRGNKTKHHPDVNPTYSDYADTVKGVVTLLNKQETRSPLDEDNCINGGDKSFAVRNTNLPIIRSQDDLEEGLLIYTPTTSPYSVYEIIETEPLEGRLGQIKVKRYSRSHTGDDPTYRSQTTTLHLQHIMMKMTYAINPTPQEELTSY
jgi:hypothetical protein